MKHSEELELLQKVQKVETPPFLLTRIHARIRAAQSDVLPTSWKWVGATAALILLVFNLYFIATGTSSALPGAIVEQYGLHSTQQLYADKN